MKLREVLLASACLLAGAIGGVIAQQPQVMGLVTGPVGVGYPILRTQPGTAASPSESSGIDVTTGEFFNAAAQMNAAVSGNEIGRWLSTGYYNGGKAVGALTTAGAGTITAALMLDGLVNRTGPTGAFTDTTDTAANIDSALGTPPVGMTFDFEYAVGVAEAATLAGGSGVTIVGSTGVVASGSRLIRCVKTAATPTYSCG